MSSLDRPHEKKLVLPGVVHTRFSASGHLLYVRDGRLLARPFDAARERLTGEPFPVAEFVAGVSPRGLFSTSATGVLVYAARDSAPSELAWFDRSGQRLGTVGQRASYDQIQLSPDGKRVVAEIDSEGGGTDLWTLDLGRGVATRATSDPSIENDPVWSADGPELFFDSDREGDHTFRLYRKRLDGSASESLLLNRSVSAWSKSVSPDGTRLVYLTGTMPNDTIWALPLNGTGEPEQLTKVDHPLASPQVSPSGRWLAYGAHEKAGAWEVYVAPFRREGERVRISPDNGGQPRWRGDGRELIYVTPQGQLMAVARDRGRSRAEPAPRALRRWRGGPRHPGILLRRHDHEKALPVFRPADPSTSS